MKDPYEIVKSRYVTEKSTMLQNLQSSTSNKSVARFTSPKYVFLVARQANKAEIASAIEEIYKEKSVRVTKVNTICVKGKPKRRGKGRPGASAGFKKAVVTMEPGDSIE